MKSSFEVLPTGTILLLSYQARGPGFEDNEHFLLNCLSLHLGTPSLGASQYGLYSSRSNKLGTEGCLRYPSKRI